MIDPLLLTVEPIARPLVRLVAGSVKSAVVIPKRLPDIAPLLVITPAPPVMTIPPPGVLKLVDVPFPRTVPWLSTASDGPSLKMPIVEPVIEPVAELVRASGLSL